MDSVSLLIRYHKSMNNNWSKPMSFIFESHIVLFKSRMRF